MAINGTDSELAKMSFREQLSLANHKRVHWAFELEEVMYFTPNRSEHEDTEEKTYSMLQKFKMKIHALKNRRLAVLFDSYDRNCLHRLQETFERIVRKTSGRFGKFYIEDVKDLNKYWDELFSLYGEYKPNVRLT